MGTQVLKLWLELDDLSGISQGYIEKDKIPRLKVQ